uniref:ADP-ribosylation factor n=1 Tax=Panagrolaimus sp. PS1159 TaxID=55785 RepID=A0AC35GRF5_9BILA
MGNTICNSFNNFFVKKVKVCMVGVDAAGKTTILYRLKQYEVVTTIPTTGFNCEFIEYENILFTIFDFGNHGRTDRPFFGDYYYEGSQALIFVVDSSDHERMNEAAEFLHDYLKEGNTLLVFANKQDKSNAMNVEEIKEKLNLKEVKTQNWHIQGCSAISGDGIYEGLDWLVQQINDK